MDIGWTGGGNLEKGSGGVHFCHRGRRIGQDLSFLINTGGEKGRLPKSRLLQGELPPGGCTFAEKKRFLREDGVEVAISRGGTEKKHSGWLPERL